MMLIRHAEELTRARSLFRDRKRSGCLMFFKAAISFSKRKGCSKASASGCALFRTPCWWSSKEWSPRLSLEEGPIQGFGGAPQPHAGPPYSRSRRPTLGPWQSFTASAPFGGPTPPPQLPLSPSFSSLSWAWGAGQLQEEERGRAGRDWDLEVSFCAGPLALSTRSSFRPFLLFRAISSSSSKLLSTRATMNLGERTTEDLSSSPFESET